MTTTELSDGRMGHDELVRCMDDCLLAIGDGRPLPRSSLRGLPPWRAVMISKVAVTAGAMTQQDFDSLVGEAIAVGGTEKLSP